MDEADVLESWSCFYSHFQDSKAQSWNYDNATVVVRNAGTSLLFDTGKSFAFDLFKRCGLLGGDIIKFNHILWKLEEECLPKIAVMYENFRCSKSGSSTSKLDEHTPVLAEVLQTDIQDKQVNNGPPADESVNLVDLERDYESEINVSRRSPNEVLPEALHSKSEPNKKLCKPHNLSSDLENQKSPKQQEDTLAGVRRSGRSVKITPRFLEVGDMILKTIKPEPSADSEEVESEIKLEVGALHLPKAEPEVLPETENALKLESKERTIEPETKASEKPPLAKHRSLSGHEKDFERQQRSCPICHTGLDVGQTLEEHMVIHAPSSGPYVCDLCQKTFATVKLVQSHLISHLRKTLEKYSCPFDGKTFKSEKSVVTHIKRKHSKDCDNPMLKCAKCPKTFRDQEQLDYHSVRHLGIKPYFCNVCGKSFLREKGLLSHKQMHEGGGFMCDVCGKSFVSQRVLEDHSTIHTGEKPHTCDVCGKSFRLRANLRYHKQVHNPSKRIQCTRCPKTLRDNRAYIRHMMMHTGEKPWRCEVCGKGFVQELSLTKHMNLHNGENRHQCQVCLKSFVDKWGLIKHSTIHTGERPYQCSVCHRSFRIKKGLEDHFKLHDTSLQLKCPLCPKSFVEQRHLDHHLRMHRGEKAYVCEICGDRFVNSMSLKVHHRRHTGEKPYKCSYCPKTFNQHGSHAAHERYHRGERPYPCDFCDAAYITRSQLTIHRRKHLNVRPYKCPQCDYAATTASLLKVHALKHSTEKPFRCSLCPAAFKRQNHLDVHSRKHQAKNEEVVTADAGSSIIHLANSGSGQSHLDPATSGTVTVVEVFQCSFCEASFPTQAGLEKHMKRHEIIVVTAAAAANQEGIFEIPAIEGAHGASSEVAYDIVLL